VFDHRSDHRTSQLWLAKNRPALTIGGALLGAAAAMVAGVLSRNGDPGAAEDREDAAFAAELSRLEERHPMPD
jgi:hypothetical protein